MGFNDENAERVILDIETAALDGVDVYLESIHAPSNYRDPQKIADYIADSKQRQIETAALDVDLCRVVAIGILTESATIPRVMVAASLTTEGEMLRDAFALIGTRTIVGFNCLDFDLPVLLRRALYQRVLAPAIQLDRFRHPQVIDLQQELSFGGKLAKRSLNFYCRRFDLDVPADDFQGRDIAGLVASSDWDAVAKHCTADVHKTRALAARIGMLSAISTIAQ